MKGASLSGVLGSSEHPVLNRLYLIMGSANLITVQPTGTTLAG